MADLIRHDSDTHAQVSDALTIYNAKLSQLGTDLNTIAQHLSHPEVWQGQGADSFLQKHHSLMKSTAALVGSVKTLDIVRDEAHIAAIGANDKVVRAFDH